MLDIFGHLGIHDHRAQLHRKHQKCCKEVCSLHHASEDSNIKLETQETTPPTIDSGNYSRWARGWPHTKHTHTQTNRMSDYKSLAKWGETMRQRNVEESISANAKRYHPDHPEKESNIFHLVLVFANAWEAPFGIQSKVSTSTQANPPVRAVHAAALAWRNCRLFTVHWHHHKSREVNLHFAPELSALKDCELIEPDNAGDQRCSMYASAKRFRQLPRCRHKCWSLS